MSSKSGPKWVIFWVPRVVSNRAQNHRYFRTYLGRPDEVIPSWTGSNPTGLAYSSPTIGHQPSLTLELLPDQPFLLPMVMVGIARVEPDWASRDCEGWCS